MSGIGVIIIILQIGPVLGHEGMPSLTDALSMVPSWLQNISTPSLILGLLSLTFIL
jgi:SulP family sulfate permease